MSVYSAAFSPDGRRIVTASEDQTARIWDAATAKLLAVLSGHDDAVARAAFSPDGRRIVTASRDQTARIWDAATARQLAVLSGHEDVRRSSRRVLARRAAHRHRLRRPDRADLGRSHGQTDRRPFGSSATWSCRPRSRPTGGASLPPPKTRPRASGTRTRPSRSPCFPAIRGRRPQRRVLTRRAAHRHRLL